MTTTVRYSPPILGRPSPERRQWLAQVWAWWRQGLNTAEMAQLCVARESDVERDLWRLIDAKHHIGERSSHGSV